MNKRGLSGIVVTVLLILLVLAAIVIIWAFARVFIFGGSGRVETGLFTIRLDIPARDVVLDETNKDVSFRVLRNAGEGELVALNVILEDPSGNERCVKREDTLDFKELETRTISRDYGIGTDCPNIAELGKISIAPFVLNKDGRELLGGIAASYKIKGTETGDGDGSPQCTPDGSTRSCGIDVGECSAGTETCTGGVWGSCVGEVGQSTEVCTGGLDEDCDGAVDCADSACTTDPSCNVPIEDAANDWTQFGKNAQHNTFVTLSSAVSDLNNEVCVVTGSSFSEPVIVGDEIILFNKDSTKLQRRRVSDCSLVAESAALSGQISDDKLYYNKGRVYAYERSPGKFYSWSLAGLGGSPVQEEVLVESIGNTPVLANDRLYYIGNGRGFYSYKATNGADNLQLDVNDATEGFSLNCLGSDASKRAVVEGGVYFAVCNAGSENNVVAYNIGTGGVVWNFGISGISNDDKIRVISAGSGKLCAPYSNGIDTFGLAFFDQGSGINSKDVVDNDILFSTSYNNKCYGNLRNSGTYLLASIDFSSGIVSQSAIGPATGNSYFFPVKTGPSRIIYVATNTPQSGLGQIASIGYDASGNPGATATSGSGALPSSPYKFISFAVHKSGKIIIVAEGDGGGNGRGLFVYGNP